MVTPKWQAPMTNTLSKRPMHAFDDLSARRGPTIYAFASTHPDRAGLLR